MSAHTPGPWATGGRNILDGKGNWLGEFDAPSWEESVANARMAAAAPDMYEALKTVPIDSAHMSEWDAWRIRHAAALAKAEGGAA